MGAGVHSMFLMQDGTVKSCGYNDLGQLGLGYKNPYVNSPQKIAVSNVKAISCGDYHTAFLMENGTVKVFGQGEYAKLGTGDTTNQLAPFDLPLTNVKQVACGTHFTLFLMQDGTVKSCGNNGRGQLGIGNTTTQTTIQNAQISGVKQIACGSAHAMFLMQDGTVKGVGSNTYGELGLSHKVDMPTPTTIDLTEVKQIACGSYHTMFLMQDGSVKVCGMNNIGQLGPASTAASESVPKSIFVENVKNIYSGGSYNLLMFKDGTIKSFGANSMGELALGYSTNFEATIKTVQISGVKQIFCGQSHTMFLMEDGTVKAVGRNTEGQLGISTIFNTSSISKTNIDNVKDLSDLIGSVIKKWLFKVGSSIKNLQAGIWTEVGTAPLTQAMFASYGMDSLTSLTDSKIRELTDPELLVWSEEKGSPPKLKTTGVLKPQLIKGTIDTAVATLTSIRIVASTTGTVRIVLSGDSGATWKGKQPVDIATLSEIKANGFTPTELNALTASELEALAPNKKIRFAYYFEQTNSTDIASVSALYVNEKKYTATPNVSALQFTHDFASKQEPIIELKQNDGSWVEVKKDEITYAKAAQEWAAIELRAKLKNDQQLNAIAYSWN